MTPLERWLLKTGGTVDSLADDLNVSRGRAYHYVQRTTLPRGPVLIQLLALTNLPIQDLVPLEQIAVWKAVGEAKRLAREDMKREKAHRKERVREAIERVERKERLREARESRQTATR